MPQPGYGRGEYAGVSWDELAPVELNTNRDPWVRQDDEPSRWYGRFRDYYVAVGANRSMMDAYKRWRKAHGLTKPIKATPKAWTYHSRLWQWKERAEAYDDYMYAQLQSQIEDERYQMLRRHVSQARAWADAGMDWLLAVKGHRIESGPFALRAWLASVDVETRALIPPQLLKIFEMGDAELLQFYGRFFGDNDEAPSADGSGESPEDERHQSRPPQDEGDSSSASNPTE